MSFNSTDYVFFLVVVFFLYWQAVRWPRFRVVFLLVSSYFFYTVWNGWLIGLILFSSLVDYLCGGLIASVPHRPFVRKLLLWTSVLINLGLLAYFKYANFFIENVAAGLDALGVSIPSPHLDILLPVGISFYTFQSLTYTIDIYRGILKPARGLSDFLLFVSFFPQLIAGPIVRAREFLPQLERAPRLTRQQVTVACYRLLIGFIKKMVIADYLAANIVDPYFRAPAETTGIETFLALTGFHFQVYCDFSGYTDIAIGSAALFGFVLPENFKTPYAAHTPANYWSRWHITLSRFCSDYIYVPLGGNRKGRIRAQFNTLVTFAVIGFWHGPSWTFVLFGVYHSMGVLGTRVFTGILGRIKGVHPRQIEQRFERRVVPIVLTNLFVIGSLALFRSPDIATALVVYERLLQWDTFGLLFSTTSLGVLGFAIVTHYVPKSWEEKLQSSVGAMPAPVQAALLLLFTVASLHMATVAQQSFVYFQF